MEEYHESYVKKVGKQLEELSKQQKKTLLDGLRQELRGDCTSLPLQPLPNKPPEEVAQELMDAVDPTVCKRYRATRKRRFWCALTAMALLLVMAVGCMCYMYHVIQELAGSYTIVTVTENPYPYRPMDPVEFTFKDGSEADFVSEWVSAADKN